VAIWRSTELEMLLGGPLDETGLTAASVQRLVDAAARESEVLELKRDPYPGAPRDRQLPWTAEQEFAKDVTALANHAGGLLLIGVVEQDGAASEAVPSVSDPDRDSQRLRQALVNHAQPVPRTAFVPIPADGGHHLAVIIPPSPLAPHAVTGGRGDDRRPLHWYVRDGAHARALAESEVAERYRARFRGADDRAARRSRVAAEGREALGRSDGLWLYTATVPQAPVPATLDAEAVRDAEQWWRSEYRFASPLGRFLDANGPPIAGPGRTTFTGRPGRFYDDEAGKTDPRDAYVELHADGSAFAATPVELNTGDGQGVGVVALVDDMTCLADACLSWTLRLAGSWGTADMVSGLRDGQADDGALSRPAELVDYRHGQSSRLRRTRSLRRPPTSVVSGDLAGCDTVRGRLVTAASAAGSVLQWFGIPEPPQIAADGTIRTNEWGSTQRARDVERWADARGISHTA